MKEQRNRHFSETSPIIGVKNARFGQLIVSYAPLPSGRIAINIQNIGRMVAAP